MRFVKPRILASQVPDLAQPGAVDKLRLPKFLQPWDHEIRSQVQGWLQTHGKDMLETITSVSMRVLQGLGSIFSLLLVLLLSFLLLQNGDSFGRGFLTLLPPKHRATAQAILRDEHRLLSQWTRAIVVVAIVTVFIYGIGYSLLGVPDSVLLAMIAFPFEFIPIIGAFIGFAIVLLVAFFSGFHAFPWLIVFFLLVRVFVDYVLQPYMMGSGEIELPTFVVIVAALIGQTLAGVPGVLLSIPAVATLRILYRYLVQRHEDESGPPRVLEASG
jgi:predicted PurR-regulated permease PerM